MVEKQQAKKVPEAVARVMGSAAEAMVEAGEDKAAETMVEAGEDKTVEDVVPVTAGEDGVPETAGEV